jgi:DNA-binding MarR family transcriptional regulator
VSYVFDVKDGELASDLSLAVMRLDRQLRVRAAHPADGRQILVAASPAGAELVDPERRASRDRLRKRLAILGPEKRDILLQAADLMTVLVDEDA